MKIIILCILLAGCTYAPTYAVVRDAYNTYAPTYAPVHAPQTTTQTTPAQRATLKKILEKYNVFGEKKSKKKVTVRVIPKGGQK